MVPWATFLVTSQEPTKPTAPARASHLVGPCADEVVGRTVSPLGSSWARS